MRRILLFIMLFALLSPYVALADDIQCTESEKRVICNLSLENYIQSARALLTNGWENSLQINITLLDGTGTKTLMRSRLEATQRCYLDPFESPCLVLWRGAAKYQKYKDEQTFLKAMSHFGIQALTLTELPADNYIVRISVNIMASAVRRLRSIRSWFKQNAGDNGSFLTGTSSLISSFLGSRAESTDDAETYTVTLDTTQFFIDLDFVPPTPDDPETDSSDATDTNSSDATDTNPSDDSEITP